MSNSISSKTATKRVLRFFVKREAVLADVQTVARFTFLEYWSDIGQHKDYLAAQSDVRSRKLAP